MWDAFWNVYVAPVPDMWTADWFGAVRDVLSVGLAALGAGLAWLAIRMGRRQTAIGEEQTRISREQTAIALRQEALDREQGQIAVRQAAIAETQHRLLENQLARRTELSFSTGSERYDGEGPLAIDLEVRNDGTKVADGFHWEVFIPKDLEDRVGFLDAGLFYAGEFAPWSETEHFVKDEGHYVHKLWPRSDVKVTTLAILEPLENDLPEFTVYWRIRCEDGIVPPPEQLAAVRFTKSKGFGYESRRLDNFGELEPVDNSGQTS